MTKKERGQTKEDQVENVTTTVVNQLISLIDELGELGKGTFADDYWGPDTVLLSIDSQNFEAANRVAKIIGFKVQFTSKGDYERQLGNQRRRHCKIISLRRSSDQVTGLYFWKDHFGPHAGINVQTGSPYIRLFETGRMRLYYHDYSKIQGAAIYTPQSCYQITTYLPGHREVGFFKNKMRRQGFQRGPISPEVDFCLVEHKLRSEGDHESIFFYFFDQERGFLELMATKVLRKPADKHAELEFLSETDREILWIEHLHYGFFSLTTRFMSQDLLGNLVFPRFSSSPLGVSYHKGLTPEWVPKQ